MYQKTGKFHEFRLRVIGRSKVDNYGLVNIKKIHWSS